MDFLPAKETGNFLHAKCKTGLHFAFLVDHLESGLTLFNNREEGES
jgi:hypothetical protein